MLDNNIQNRLFDLGKASLTPVQDRCTTDYAFATSEAMPADDEFARLGTDSVIEISFDRFSDG